MVNIIHKENQKLKLYSLPRKKIGNTRTPKFIKRVYL